MIDKHHPHFSVVRQCKLLGLHRNGVYYNPVAESGENLPILRVLDEQYLRTPFFEVRRLRAWLGLVNDLSSTQNDDPTARRL